MPQRPRWLYPRSPVRINPWARAMAGLKLVLFLVLVLGGLAIGSVLLRDLLESRASDDDGEGPSTPTTEVDGLEVALMASYECDVDGTPITEIDPAALVDGDTSEPPPCRSGAVLIGNDVYVLNADPPVLVKPENVTDEVFAAGEIGEIERAFVVENVDPAVLLAGQSGATYFAITGPSIESTVAEPTIEQLFTVCVSITDVFAYRQCAEINDRQAEPDDADSAPGG